jgi:hypothetical protein
VAAAKPPLGADRLGTAGARVLEKDTRGPGEPRVSSYPIP